MAVRFRCTDCGRKISVNDVFADGMCRCPACRAFIFVPGEPAGARRTVRPEMPASPGVGHGRHAALALRVHLRSAVAIALALLAVAMAAVAIIHCLRRG